MEHKNHLVPPQNIEAELSILGGLMLEQEAWDEISDIIEPGDFYKPAHRIIYTAIKELQHKNQPTDLITISNLLMENKQLDSIGGPGVLADIIEQTPSAANIVTYADIVKEKSLLRELIKVNSSITEEAYNSDYADINSFLDSVESRIFSLAEKKATQGLIDASQLVKASLEKLESLYARQGEVTGVPSGFADFDGMTAGFQPGEMTILAARPSMGKTALSLNIVLNAAVREKKSVAYFSVEMSKESVMTRMLANEAKIKLGDLRVGSIDDKSWPKLINTAAILSESNIFIDDTSGISPFEVRAKARRLKAKHGLDMIMIDYLQLMSLKQKVDSREREVSEISKTLKAIAKELEVPVVALAQLNRSVEGRSDRRPMLSDLRESGSIEQDADIIMMIYREDYYDRDNPDIKGLAEVIIGKQRNGPTGTVKLRWIPEYGLFKDNVENAIGPSPPFPSAAPQGGPPSQKGHQKGGPVKNFAPGT